MWSQFSEQRSCRKEFTKYNMEDRKVLVMTANLGSIFDEVNYSMIAFCCQNCHVAKDVCLFKCCTCFACINKSRLEQIVANSQVCKLALVAKMFKTGA